MSIIQLNLPSGANVVGALRTRERVQNLDQDMVYVQLPGGVFIDVGWYPDRDPNGEYRLTVHRGTFENQIEAQIRTTDVRAIERAIYQYAEKYLPAIITAARGEERKNDEGV